MFQSAKTNLQILFVIINKTSLLLCKNQAAEFIFMPCIILTSTKA